MTQPTPESTVGLDAVLPSAADTIAASAQDRFFDTAHLRHGLKRRTVRSGVVTLSSQLAKFAIRTGGTSILAHLLTPTDFGLIAMVAVITGLAETFKDAGLSMATVQREHITHAQVSTLFWINVTLSTCVMIVIASISPAVAWFYGEPRLAPITFALSGTTVFGGLAVQHQALLRRKMQFGHLAAIEIVSMMIGTLTAVGMALYGYAYWSLVGLIAATAVTTAAMSVVMSGWVPGWPSRGSGVRPMLAFGGGVTGFTFVNYFTRNTDNLLVGFWWGPVSLGLYSRAYTLLLLPITQIIRPLISVVQPALSRLEDNERFRRAFLKALRIVVLSSAPLIGVLAGGASLVVHILLGPKWSAAVAIFRPLSIASLAQPLLIMSGVVLTSRGEGRIFFRQSLIMAIPTVLGFCVAVPFGAVAVAWSYAITTNLIVAPLIFSSVSKVGPVSAWDFYKIALKGAAVASVCAIPSFLISRAFVGT